MSANAAMYIGVSGMTALSTAMRVVSDNIANSNTTAFKSNTLRFGDMVSGFMPITSDDSDRMGAGVSILGTFEDFGQGALVGSNNWSDVSIEGEGFFAVSETNDGKNTAQTYYTRDGSFHTDDNGYLVNTSGYNVLDDTGTPIKLLNYPDNPEYNNFYVDESGEIYGTRIRNLEGSSQGSIKVTGGAIDPSSTNSYSLLTDADTVTVNVYDSTGKLVTTHQDTNVTAGTATQIWDGNIGGVAAGDDTYTYTISTSKDNKSEAIGKMQIAIFENKDGLMRAGGNMYSTSPTSGNPIISGDTWTKTIGKVTDYNLESSNVDITTEMVNMIVYQASYNANSKSITTSSDMVNTAVNLIR